MKILLLSGGSGKRLWPLSNDIRSKQFLKLLKNDEDEPESMVQRVYRQIQEAGIKADIVVATGISQEDSILSHLGNKVDIVLEPERRDTFPAIVLGTSYLFYKKQMDPDEVVVVLPVDPYTETTYFDLLHEIAKKVQENVSNIALMGIKPTYPSEKYGYIIPDVEKKLVKRFQEKPSEEMAGELIEEGALWNGGVFAFKVGYMMQLLENYISFDCFEDIYEQYALLPKTSFDYEVLEKEASIAMVEYSGTWKDLGTWNTLTEVMSSQALGEVTAGDSCQNTHIINELDIPITVLGARNMVIAASPDGILVSDKDESSYLKDYVKGYFDRPMYEESAWGDYKVIDFKKNEDDSFSLTKAISIKAGECLKYQEHAIREEIWTIVDGIGDIVLDGHVRNVKRGDVAYISKGQKHSILAVTDMRLIEVEIGNDLSEADAITLEWSWERS